MKTILKYIYLIIAVLLISCSHSHYFPEMEAVLKQAHKNRSQLEKVLKHYSQNPADSLKLRAAEFLILNMPGKYSEYYDAPWNDLAAISLRWTSSPDKQRVLDTYKIGEPVKQEDIKCITAEYLINNIELSFKAWQERPWGKHIPFDAFCEDILPYRINTEPLENWREKAIASFAGLDSELNKTETTAVEACKTVNSVLPQFRIDKDFPKMNFSQLMASTRGQCDEMAALAAFTMRALGIPVSIEFTPHWLQHPTGHSWNAVRDSAGSYISFMGTGALPGAIHQGVMLPKSKAYRKTFAYQTGILTEERNIPPLLENSKNLLDVSAMYADCVDTVTVSLRYPPTMPTGYVYLAIEYNYKWYPVAWSADSGQTARFTSVGRNIIYQPVYYSAGAMTPAGDPFWLDDKGEITVFAPDSPDSLITFKSTEPMSNDFQPRMIGGRFEGANKSDFSDAKVLHVIRDKPERGYNSVKLRNSGSYRYVRYISYITDSYCNVSEIIFFGSDGTPLHGDNIGTPNAWDNTSNTCDKAFDGDVRTFYDALNSKGDWTGLDLREKQKISEIRFCPRHEGDYIFASHEYELFYRSKTGWTSLGRQVADSNILQYRAPKGALMYLEDITSQKKGLLTFFISEQKTGWRVYDLLKVVTVF
jgi:hypothetical protein